MFFHKNVWVEQNSVNWIHYQPQFCFTVELIFMDLKLKQRSPTPFTN